MSDQPVRIFERKDTFFIGIIVGGAVTLAVLGLTYAFTLRPSDPCVANCHPHVAKIIEDACHCAVDDGWLGYIEGETEIVHGDTR